MTVRIYVTDTEIVQGPRGPQHRPVWNGILEQPYPVQAGQAIETEKFNIWIGSLDTDDTQHTALIVDPRVSYVPSELAPMRFNQLTVAQQAALEVLRTRIGYPVKFHTNNFKVVHILMFLMGKICFHPIRTAIESDPDINN